MHQASGMTREVCLLLLCAIHVSSGLLLSPSAALSPSAQRALPRRVRVSHLVAAEEDDLLASFRQSTAPTEDQALKQAESLRDDDEPEILEPSFQELVAKMPQYEKVRRPAFSYARPSLPCFSHPHASHGPRPVQQVIIGVAAGLFLVFIVALIAL